MKAISRALTPQKPMPPRFLKENFDPNTMPLPSDSGSSQLRSMPFGTKTRSPLPPKPPIHPSSLNHGGNPLKRKLNLETDSNSSDSGVQVVVRMRPLNNEEESSQIVQKVLPNSVSILDHTFTFDAVADTRSTQLDIFKLVGIPLVENCLAGFNSSIFAYGQTGSGKTYTMWGPPSALSAKHELSEERGLTPRVFERLFSRLAEEQAKHSDKQLSYQCRCSFLEIYNEHITDLLDPTQKNLQIREDVKTGIYVDYLTEENVCTMKDVVQLLDKGLAHRRTGETSINAESSRSHCVFTCVVESRSKRVTDGLSNIRISRINLVDLAGSESQRKTGAAGERLKEAGNINRSLSQLGNLINILAEVSQSGKTRHIPYRDSRLTFLLQESLGGNAKLAMICAISPSQSCKSETFSTLRFAYRAKAIKNKAVVNEVTQDDVNVLREQIRQLKDELLRMKSTGTSSASNRSYSTGWNARRSLNILKMSLNCPRLLPVAEEDDDEEMEIDNDDVEKAPLNMEVQSSRSNNESDQVSEVRHSSETSQKGEKTAREGPKVQKIATEQAASADSVVEEIVLSNEVKGTMILAKMMSPNKSSTIKCTQANTSVSSSENMLIEEKSNKDSPCQKSPVLHSPTLSISPLFETSCKRSLRKSSSISASKGNISINAKSSSSELRLSFAGNLKRSKNFLLRPEDLEASLHRGLQIIDSHRQSLSLRQSTFRFSIKPVDLIPSMPVVKVDVGMQTLPQELELSGDLSAYICSYCKNRPPPLEYDDNTNYEKELKLVPIEGSKVADKCKTRIPKTVEKVLSGAVRREMALEDHCAQQAAEIMQLNRLIQQYKHERECRAVIEQTQGDKISRLESLMDGILPTEDFLEEEFTALTNEHKFLKEKYENHPEVLRLNIELKRAQDELEGYRNFCAMGERDVLLEEIQDLKCHLQYYTDPSSLSTLNRIPLIHSIRSTELCLAPLSTIPDSTEESSDDKKEEEDRCHWAETESKWISLCEELRSELEANRSLAEKTKLELETEKKCAEELKEALQTAMHGHARILEQYADLQEKHIALLGRHRMMTDGIEDVTKAAAKAGIKGSESKFVKSLAAEISALKSEREKERRYWRDENKGLQAQLRDTAEAVQAAGELLVRLKEAEEATANAQKRTLKAELEIEKAYEEIDSLKKHYEQQIELSNQLLADSNLPKEALQPTFTNAGTANFDPRECSTDKKWREELESFEQGDGEFSRGTEPHSWFSDYDRCNI